MGFVQGKTPLGVNLIKNGQCYVYDEAQDRFIPVDLPVSSLKTAVVDIGPHSNNGPGDQTKGILDWSTVLIDLAAAPGLGKTHHIGWWEFQYRPVAAAYVDPG